MFSNLLLAWIWTSRRGERRHSNVGGLMRARMERKHLGGPPAWLAAAAWLWASQAAWAQSPTLGLRAGEEIKPERIKELYRNDRTTWPAGQGARAPDELIELDTTVSVDTDARTHKTLLKA